MNEWIPIKYNYVTQRFDGKVPCDNQRVVVSTNTGYVFISTFYDIGNIQKFEECTRIINAWMPLPESYKGVYIYEFEKQT